MDGRVLGPVGVEVEGRREVAGTTKVAGLFALLATSSGLSCSREEIIDVLWPDVEDEKKRKDLVNWAVGKLRGRLGAQFVPHGARSGRCTLQVPAGSIDYLRFLEGYRRAGPLPPPERFERLRAALDEWSDGEPLRGLQEAGFEVLRQRMRQERIDAVCRLLQAAWEAMETKFLCDESEKWWMREPENPRIFAYYLLAHGRDMPERERERLVTRWKKHHGEPDDFLRNVIAELRGEPPRAGGAGFLPLPDQLPAEERCPVGQEELVRELLALVDEARGAGRTAFVFLNGMAGVGKSTLALHLAHRLRGKFPDGALYGELNGHADGASPTDPEQILDGFLAALPPYSTVAGLSGKSAALRTALAHRSALLFLDNAFSAKQIKWLLPGAGTCAVIVTSRDELGSLSSRNGAIVRKVEVLRDEDALEVLQEKVSEKDRPKHAQAFGDLIELCGNLPLALTIVARRLTDRSPHTIPALVREMRKEKETLESLHLPEDELSVRVALSCSVRELGKEARLLLWQLAVHPGPSLSWEAVMDIGVGTGEPRTDRVLRELLQANLVERQSDRYRLHDLVRAFARHHVVPVPLEDLEAVERATLRQVLEHQLQNIRACDRALDSTRSLPIGEPEGVTVVEPDGPGEAMEWMDREYDTARQCLMLADKEGIHRYSWLLPMVLVTYQWRRRRLNDALGGLRHAVEIAAGTEPPADLAMAYRMQAGTQWRLGQFDGAAANLARAVRLSRQDDSERGRLSLARSLYVLGVTLRKREEGTAAEAHLRQALELYQELAEPVGEAAALNAIGALHLDRGEYGEALRRCTDALRVVERTTDQNGRADVLFTLAKVRLARAERDEAVPLYRQACDIYGAQESRTEEERTRRLFADVLVSAGRVQEAVEELERVLVLREQMEDADPREIRDLLEGLR